MDKDTSRTVHIQPGTDLNDVWQELQAEPDSQAPNLGADRWQSPQPIHTLLKPVLPMEPGLIPEPLRDWLTDIAHRMKCPLDFVASATVVMLSSLIGTRLTIKPKSRDDWTITPNLWGAVIGDPSTMKTPSVSEVFKPLTRLILESRAEFEQAQKHYEAEQSTYEAQKKVHQSQEQDRLKGKKVDNPVGYPEAPQKPTERRYMTNDATIEKIGDLLNENPSGLLQFRDELVGLLAGWDRAGREQDRTFYLEAWNGSGSITIDRIGRGTTHVKTVCLSLFGGIQPAKLTGYLQDATGYENDGFVQRLQLAVYPDKSEWGYVDEFPNREARDRAFALIRQVSDSDFSAIAFPSDEFNKSPYTRFTEPAQRLFQEWLTHWEEEVLPNDSGLLLEHFTKYRSLMPSLALIFHVVSQIEAPAPSDPNRKNLVSLEAAQMAVDWCRYLQSHARRVYGLLDSMGTIGAKELANHLKAGDLPNGFKARDVQRKQWSFLTKAEQVDAALAVLLANHWIHEEQPRGGPSEPVATGRPPAPCYWINPVILSKCIG